MSARENLYASITIDGRSCDLYLTDRSCVAVRDDGSEIYLSSLLEPREFLEVLARWLGPHRDPRTPEAKARCATCSLSGHPTEQGYADSADAADAIASDAGTYEDPRPGSDDYDREI